MVKILKDEVTKEYDIAKTFRDSCPFILPDDLTDEEIEKRWIEYVTGYYLQDLVFELIMKDIQEDYDKQ